MVLIWFFTVPLSPQFGRYLHKTELGVYLFSDISMLPLRPP